MDDAPKTRGDVMTAIYTACATITQEEINVAIDSFLDRFKACVEAEGGRFEHKK